MKKRIALGVVAALAGGLLAAAPASAAMTSSAVTTSSSSAVQLLTADAVAGTLLTTVSTTLTGAGNANLVNGVDSVTVAVSDATDATYTTTGLAAAVQATVGSWTVDSTTTSATTDSATVKGATLGGTNGTYTDSATALGNAGWTVAPTLSFNSASTTLNLYLKSGLLAGSYRIKIAMSAGASVGLSNPIYVTLVVGATTGRAQTISATTASTTAGGTVSFTVTDAYSTSANNVSSLSVSASASGTTATGLSVTPTAGTATGGASVYVATSATAGAFANTKNAIAGAFSVTHSFSVKTPSDATAGGTYTVTVGGKSIVITIQPSAIEYGSSTATFAATIANGGYYAGAAGDGILYGPKTANAGNPIGKITVKQFDTTGTAIANAAYAKNIVVSISGPGSLATIGTNTSPLSTTMKTVSAANYSGAAGEDFFIHADGTAGTATVTVKVNDVVVATKTVKFYGNATKMEVTKNYTVLRAGTAEAMGSLADVAADSVTVTGGFYLVPASTNDPALAVIATDALGTRVPVTLSATSSNGNKLSATLTQFTDAGLGLYTAGVFAKHVVISSAGAAAASGDAATLTLVGTNADGTTITSDVPVTFGGAASKITMGFDKASYAPGEMGTLTLTVKDAAGNVAYDNQQLLLASASSNLNNGGTLPTVAGAYNAGGKYTKTVYAPVANGTWTVSATDINANVVSASATVAIPASATETANAAAIATLQTSVAALQTTVASLVASMTAQIKVINAALVKIARSLKVKL